MVVDQFGKTIAPRGMFISLTIKLQAITSLPRGPMRSA
jgi:hypothetical protein